MPENEYQRLTQSRARSGFAVAAVRRSSLWLGRDHLLCIDTNGYTEIYKRFYFRDIQAVTIRQTNRRAVWNWVLAVLTAPCLVGLITMSFQSGQHTAGVITLAILTGLLALPLLINNVLGPTCICHLRTAVQTEELPPLNRVNRFHKVLERLRPLIATAQGELLAPEEIPARLRQMVQSSAAGAAAGDVVTRSAADDPDARPRIIS